MKKTNECIPQHISKFTLGIILLGAALGLALIGITLLPIIGLVAAVPVALLGLYFLKVNLNDQCEIEFSAK